MTFLLINENGASFIDIPNKLEDLNKALGWNDAWNTPTIYIEDHAYIIICSDLGKVRHERVSALSFKNLISPTDNLREPFIVGNIIISKFNGVDDFASLTKKDQEILNSRLMEHHYTSTDFYPCILIID